MTRILTIRADVPLALADLGPCTLIGEAVEIYPREIVIGLAPEPYLDVPITPLLAHPKTHPTSPRESLRRKR